jgi:hypothetical protein
MTSQLRYDEENGKLWTRVKEILSKGIDENGKIITGESLE